MNPSPYARRGRFVQLAYLLLAFLFLPFAMMRSRTVVLCYHSVKPDEVPGYLRQMRLVSRMKRAGHRVEVTFDDGFKSILRTVVPTMESLELQFYVFVVAGVQGCPPPWLDQGEHTDADETLLDRSGLTTLAKTSVASIGSHTMTHKRLSTLDGEALDAELGDSKRRLEAILGVEVNAIAFPYGDFNDRVAKRCRTAGYQRAYSLVPSAFPVDWSENTIGRFSVSPSMSYLEYWLTLHGAYSFLCKLRPALKKFLNQSDASC